MTAGKENFTEIEGLNELIQRGKQSGVLTYQEVMDALQEADLTPEQIDDIYARLQSQGVDIAAEASDAGASHDGAIEADGSAEAPHDAEQDMDIPYPEGR